MKKAQRGHSVHGQREANLRVVRWLEDKPTCFYIFRIGIHENLYMNAAMHGTELKASLSVSSVGLPLRFHFFGTEEMIQRNRWKPTPRLNH